MTSNPNPTNGAHGFHSDPLPAVKVETLRALASMEIDSWDDAVTSLDLALLDACRARAAITEIEAEQSLIAAHVVLNTTGGNAESRKAEVTVTLAEDSRYQDLDLKARAARLKLGDAERRATVARHRCRLLQASLALLMGSTPEP